MVHHVNGGRSVVIVETVGRVDRDVMMRRRGSGMRGRLRLCAALALPCLVGSILAATDASAHTRTTADPDTTVVPSPPADPGASTTVPLPYTETPPLPAPAPESPSVPVQPAPEIPPPAQPTGQPAEREAELRPDEDLAAARADVQERLERAGDIQTVVLALRAEIESELTTLDAELAAAEASAAAAAQEALDAAAARAVADSKVQAAERACGADPAQRTRLGSGRFHEPDVGAVRTAAGRSERHHLRQGPDRLTGRSPSGAGPGSGTC